VEEKEEGYLMERNCIIGVQVPNTGSRKNMKSIPTLGKPLIRAQPSLGTKAKKPQHAKLQNSWLH